MATDEELILAAQAQVKAVYDEGVAEINNRSYTFNKMTFSERRKVFAFMTNVKNELQDGNFSFLDSKVYKEDIEKTIYRNVTLDGMTLSKKNPFEEHLNDYIPFVTIALGVISYPFMHGGDGE